VVVLLEVDEAERAERDDQIAGSVAGFGKGERAPGEGDGLRELAEECEGIGEPCVGADAPDIAQLVGVPASSPSISTLPRSSSAARG